MVYIASRGFGISTTHRSDGLQHRELETSSMYLDNITARVAVLQVTIRVGCTVPALMYALALALLRSAVDSGADPYNVVRGEAGPVLLQLPSHRHKLLQDRCSLRHELNSICFAVPIAFGCLIAVVNKTIFSCGYN